MKKSEMIKKLEAIEGDLEITFAVSEEVIGDYDHNYWYADNAKVNKVKVCEYNDSIFVDVDELCSEMECIEYDEDNNDNDFDEKAKALFDSIGEEKIEIRIDV